MDFYDIARSIVEHAKPYTPMNFTGITITCDYTGVKPPIRCYAVIKGSSDLAPMWSSDMIKNLKVDFENYRRVCPKDVVRVEFHIDLDGEFYFKYDFKKDS